MKTAHDQLYVRKSDYDELMIDVRNLAIAAAHAEATGKCQKCAFALKYHYALMDKLNDSSYRICDTIENILKGEEETDTPQKKLF